MKLKNITDQLFILYWPLVMLNYLLLMSTKINLTLLLVDAPLVFFVINAGYIMIKKSREQFIGIYGLFALYVLLSLLGYCNNGTPVVCYFKGIQYYFIPLCFAALGYSFSSDYRYNKSYLYSCAACFIIGFLLYATLPPFYVTYLAEVQGFEDFSQDELMGMTRFSSFLPGSYNISYLSVPALILSLAYASRPKSGIKSWVCYIIAAVSFVAAIICQQRIAMAFAILVVGFYSIYLSRRGNSSFFFSLVAIIVILVIIVVYFISELPFFETLLEHIVDRFKNMDIAEAMAARTGQYTGFNRATWWSYIVGLGMGSCGHLVIPYNLQAIYDGELVKTFYEFGIIGVVIFAFLIFVTLLRGVKLFRYLHSEVLILLFFLGASVGASALTFFIYSSMFWFAIGRIWNDDYLALRKQELTIVRAMRRENKQLS